MKKFILIGSILFSIVIISMAIFLVRQYDEYKKPIAFNATTNINADMTKKIINSSLCEDVNSCALKGDDIIYNKLAQEAPTEPVEEAVEPGNIQEGDIIAKYRVQGDEIIQIGASALTPDKQQIAQQQFKFFTELIPAEWRKNIKQYAVVNNSNISAYVMRLGDVADGQELGIDINFMNSIPEQSAKINLIHEFAHIFSDNYDQYINNQSCELIKTHAGLYCLKEKSYLNQFYLAFWNNVPLYWVENTEKAPQDIMEFYSLNENKFVTAYAASNPYEDFAESFTEFVITPYDMLKEGTQANEKIEFFYQYPELVLLRYQLLQNLAK